MNRKEMTPMNNQKSEPIIPIETKGAPEYLDMHYNTNLKPLKIPEYGRMIHQMVDYLKTIEDREKRNFYAREIIRMMGLKNKNLRDIPDFQHKLWDHLFIMAGFNLDVDAPYPKPDPETLKQKPPKIDYPHKGYKYRFYGHIIHKLIEEAVLMEDEEKKNKLIKIIANHMKKNYLNWNRDHVDDAIIFQHLYEMSGGKIRLNPETDELMRKEELIKKRKNKNHKNKNNKR